MNSVIAEIGKKELKTTFRSKSIIIPLLMGIGIPLFAGLFVTLQLAAEGSELIYAPLLFLQVLPAVIITALVGLNAFSNEINWRTIKSLLVAPVSEKEIFIGKSLACIVTGLVVEACLAVIILILLPIAVDIPILVILLAIGPLLVMFATFMIIAVTSRFPSSAAAGVGAAAFIPMIAILAVFFLCFFLQMLLQMNPIAMQVMIALIVATLTFVTYFIATKWFNRERLVTGL